MPPNQQTKVQQTTALQDTHRQIANNSGIPQLAAQLKAAGDPLRLEVLRLLAQDSYSVLELCRIFELRQPALSHHLKVLTQAGLVNKRREGNNLFYRRAGSGQLLQQLFASLDQLPLNPDRQTAAEQVALERAEASRRFFADYGNRFREQQELIAAYSVYGPQVAQLLNPLPRHWKSGRVKGNFWRSWPRGLRRSPHWISRPPCSAARSNSPRNGVSTISNLSAAIPARPPRRRRVPTALW
jgi:ArsR family transcriptional regulator